MAVASQVLVWGGSEEQFIAALLHEVLEDGGVEYAESIEADFGPNVLCIVKALSDALPKAGEKKKPWMERKTEYLAHLAQAGCRQMAQPFFDPGRSAQTGDEVFKRFVGSAPDMKKKKRLAEEPKSASSPG